VRPALGPDEIAGSAPAGRRPPRDRPVETAAQLPPVPISDRVEPSPVMPGGRVNAGKPREALDEGVEVRLDLGKGPFKCIEPAGLHVVRKRREAQIV
jgi:hypothetical protein